MAVLSIWHDFFMTTAGAAAALAGLIIVAMSVNIVRIVKIPTMPSRAAATIGSLVLVVVIGAAALIPPQPVWGFGLEVLVAAMVSGDLTGDSVVRILRRGREPRTVATSALSAAQVVPFLVGGILLIARLEAGLVWLAAGVLIVFIGSVLNAWVLLVEILR